MTTVLTVLVTALAVAMDAVAVSITSGMRRGAKVSWREVLAMAGVFGAFQAIMPALGFAAGEAFHETIEAWDHWVAFGLLAAVGGHMIYESLSGDDLAPKGNPFAWRSLLVLGFATSIDAAAVGITLSIIDMPMLVSVAIIGAVTFLLCIPAVRMGRQLGTKLAHRAELAGGVVLVLIGVKILVEHLAS